MAVINTHDLLTVGALVHAVSTLLALACLVRIRVGLNYSPENLALMLAIYALAALPFFTGGAVISLAFARLRRPDQRALRSRPARRGGRLSGADSAAQPLRRAGRRDDRGGPLDRGRGSALRRRGHAARVAVAGLRPVRLPRGRSGGGRAPFDVVRHQGPRGRPRAVQQVEFVLADRSLRPPARRLVAQPAFHRRTRRIAVHGHRLGRVDADPEGHRPRSTTRHISATS